MSNYTCLFNLLLLSCLTDKANVTTLSAMVTFDFFFLSGYMAPEYALRGYLTDKADVYSFGIVALEIVSGRSNTNYRPKEESVYLLDWVNHTLLYWVLINIDFLSLFQILF